MSLCLLGRHSAPRRREESDRMELLQQAEPIDFTPEGNENFEDFTNAYTTYGGTGLSQPRRSNNFGSVNKGPPKGIFDDI